MTLSRYSHSRQVEYIQLYISLDICSKVPGAHLVEPAKAHAATLDPAPKLGDDQEVGEAAGLHLRVLLHDVV